MFCKFFIDTKFLFYRYEVFVLSIKRKERHRLNHVLIIKIITKCDQEPKYSQKFVIHKLNIYLCKNRFKKSSKIKIMIIQYIIIGIVILSAILYAVIRSYKSVQDNIKCKDYKCAGCAFYDKCRNKQKK
jgi:hypothetical protein